MNQLTQVSHRIASFSALCGLVIVLSGCPQGGGGGLEGTVVNVALKEFSVTPDVDSVAAGVVTFHVSNTGTVTHEFLVIKTDLAPDALPTEANGSYQEDGPGTEVVDEISGISPGRSSNLTLTLEAGNYVLICNMVNQGISHYAQGMRVGFTVTDGGQ